MTVHAHKLTQIRDALGRTFGSAPVVQGCADLQHKHLIYAHTADIIDAKELVPPSDDPERVNGADEDFHQRVNAWKWPTILDYEEPPTCLQIMPYGQFVLTRFLWKELQHVLICDLPDNAQEAWVETQLDGGAVIRLRNGSRLESPVHGTSILVSINVPPMHAVSPLRTQPQQIAYPRVRNVCFSRPGHLGDHGEVNAPDCPDGNEVVLSYSGRLGPARRAIVQSGSAPRRVSVHSSSDDDSTLRVVSVMPHFRFELRPPAPGLDRIRIANPWAPTSRLFNSHAFGGWALYETTTEKLLGNIARFRNRRTGAIRYGIRYSSAQHDQESDMVRGRFDQDLSDSRRLLVSAVMDVEGGPTAVQTYDGDKLSWGINQWTWLGDSGEIQQILSFIYDFYPAAFDRCFGRHGIGVWFNVRHVDVHSDDGWTRAPYRIARRDWNANRAVIFRVPCCFDGRSFDGVRRHLATMSPHEAMARNFTIRRSDTTSCAMIYLFHMAGFDADIQEAQVRWTSYRITWSLRQTHSQARLSNRQALARFLQSLGASGGTPEDRTEDGEAAVRGRVGSPQLNEEFSDVRTKVEWRKWDAAVTARPAPDGTQQDSTED